MLILLAEPNTCFLPNYGWLLLGVIVGVLIDPWLMPLLSDKTLISQTHMQVHLQCALNYLHREDCADRVLGRKTDRMSIHNSSESEDEDGDTTKY